MTQLDGQADQWVVPPDEFVTPPEESAPAATPSAADVFANTAIPFAEHTPDGRTQPVTKARTPWQVKPDTAAKPGYGVTPAQDQSDDEYERVGKDYARAMLDKFNGSPALAAMAYNAGPERVTQWLQKHGDPRKGEISEDDFINAVPPGVGKYARDALSKMPQAQPPADQFVVPPDEFVVPPEDQQGTAAAPATPQVQTPAPSGADGAPSAPDPYDTRLSPDAETQFQAWKQQYAPNDSGEDYDLRGAYQAGLTPDPQTGHWPDTFKKPNHPTFSDESMYAQPPYAAAGQAGHWEGPNHDIYVPAGQPYSEDEIKRLQSQVDEGRKQITALGPKIDDIGKQLAAAKEPVDRLQTKLAPVAQALEAMDKDSAALLSDLHDLKAQRDSGKPVNEAEFNSKLAQYNSLVEQRNHFADANAGDMAAFQDANRAYQDLYDRNAGDLRNFNSLLEQDHELSRRMPALPQTSAVGAFARGAERGVIPAAGGMVGAGAGLAAGTPIGAAAGLLGGPLAPVTVPLGATVGGIVGGVAGSFGGSAAASQFQSWVLDRLPDTVKHAIGQDIQQQKADTDKEKYATFAGELAPNLALFRPSFGRLPPWEEGTPVYRRVFGSPITARVASAGIMGAQEAGQEVAQGEPLDPGKVAISAGLGALMDRPTKLGYGLMAAGAAPVAAALPFAVRARQGAPYVTPGARGLPAPEEGAGTPPPGPEPRGASPPPGGRGGPGGAQFGEGEVVTVKPLTDGLQPYDVTVLSTTPDGKYTNIRYDDGRKRLVPTSFLADNAMSPTAPRAPEAAPPAATEEGKPISEEDVFRVPPDDLVMEEPAAREPGEDKISKGDLEAAMRAPVERPSLPVGMAKGEAKADQPISNRVLADANVLGDGAEAETVKTEGFNSLQRDAQQVVLAHVRGALNNDQVLRSVVQAVPVDVMNLLVGRKVTPEDLLHDPSVLAGRLSVPRDVPIPKPVSTFINLLASAVKTGTATATAKEAGLGAGPSVIQLPDKRGTAVDTRGRDLRQSVSAGQPITVDVNPTAGQKEAGNYLKGAVNNFHGMDIAIENPRGSVRSGTGPDGTPWAVKLPVDYGYIKGTTSADSTPGKKQGLDVYIGDNPKSTKAYVIDQHDLDTGKFDEPKSVVAVDSPDQARQIYDAGFSDGSGPDRRAVIKELPIADFRDWAKSDGPKTAIATQDIGRDVTDETGPQPVGAPLTRPVDDRGKPIYAKGERVVIGDEGLLKGRHGTVAESNALVMQGLLGGKRETSYHYTVKTDEGHTTHASSLAEETERPTHVIMDPVIEGQPTPPHQVQASIGYAKQAATKAEGAAGRSRKAQSRDSWLKEAKLQKEKAARHQAILDAWGRKNPEALPALKSAEPVAPAALPKPPAPTGATYTENAERDGVEVRFKAKPDDETLRRLKAGGYRWSSRQGLWYARRTPATIGLAKEFSGKAPTLATPTPAEYPSRQNVAVASGAATAQEVAAIEASVPTQAGPKVTRRIAALPAGVEPAWTELGKNIQGQTLYADQRGVRSYIRDGVRITEPVGMRPTRGGVEMTVERVPNDPQWDYVSVAPSAAGAPAAPAKMFYVTMIREPGPNQKVAWLAGPFATHAEALSHVDAAREKAAEVDPFTHFDAFGTASREGANYPPGTLNEALGIKASPEAPKPGTETTPPALSVEASKPTVLADKVAAFLGDHPNKLLSADALHEMAEEVYGGTLASGTIPRDEMYDALELGLSRFMRRYPSEDGKGPFSPAVDAGNAIARVGYLDALKNRLPTQTVRAGEKETHQQFSTPPDYAYAGAWAADLRRTDVVLEPSAGTGSFVVPALNAGVRHVYANDLSERRAEMLRSLKPTGVTTENAEHIHAILPKEVKPTVILMNPPFSAAAGRMEGKKLLDVGANHVEEALRRLEPGGRLVAIVGQGMKPGTPTFKDFWARIGAAYNVRANIGVEGGIYRKYGTTFPTRLLVIDKVLPTGKPPVVVEDIKDARGIIEALREVKSDRPVSVASERAPAESGRPGVAGQGQGAVQPVAPVPPPTGVLGPGKGRPGAVAGRPGSVAGPGQPVAGGEGQRGPRAGAGVPLAPQQPERTAAARTDIESGAVTPTGEGPLGGGSGGAGDGVVPDGSGQRVDPGVTEAPVTVRATEQSMGANVHDAPITDAIYESYKPERAIIAGSKPHPGPLVQSAAMATVRPPMPQHNLAVPAGIIESGALSDAQLEAVIYAGHAHSEMLPESGKMPERRRGFFIGDGTGVGKGREVSGIILDNWMQGGRKHIWVSEKKTLINDARRDWGGLKQNPKDIVDHGAVKAGDKIPHKQGILFTTYDTLRSAEQIKSAVPAADVQKRIADLRYMLGHIGTEMSTLKESDRPALAAELKAIESGRKQTGKTRVQQIIDWVGPDFDGVIAFDESHNLGNSFDVQGNRGMKKAAAKALAGVELQNSLPKARVVYVSATGATEVNNLAYADRLGLWGRNTAFPTRESFLTNVSQGGVAAMELVARDMKALGYYIARNLSYEGVEYDRLEHPLTPEQHGIYDKLADAWQLVLRNFNAAMRSSGVTGTTRSGATQTLNAQAKSAILSQFWGTHQRFFNQVVTSMQMPTVLTAVENDLRDGRQAVLQLVNTNEAAQERALAKVSAEDDAEALEELDMSPRDQLLQLVSNAFPTQRFEQYTDENNNVRSRPVEDANGNPVHDPALIEQRERLLDELGSVRVPDGPLEMLMNHFGTDKVAEVTGRKQRVVRAPDEKTGQMRTVVQKRPASSNIAEANDFQNGKKPILVFSEAGGTGRSYHADINSDSANARRSHYLVQPGWRADKAVQGFGRTHRTNQASAPIFHLVTTDLQGQRRFVSSIARRLGQLGALTKGERRTGNQGLFGLRDNLESDEARVALRGFFNDVMGGKVEGLGLNTLEDQMGLKLIDPATGRPLRDPPQMTQFLNRLLSLRTDTQNRVFNEFSRRLDDVLDRAAAAGTLDTGVETYKADKIVKKADQVVYTDPHSGAETRHVQLETSQRNYPRPFADVSGRLRRDNADHAASFVRSVRSGKIFGVADSTPHTDKNGNIVEQKRLVGPLDYQFINAHRLDDSQFWTPLKPGEDKTAWDAHVAQLPKFNVSDLHLITGAVLPIWDRLGGNPRIYRLQTDGGERMLGRVVPNDTIADTLTRLGAEQTKITATPAQVAQRVLGGETAQLANGWKIKRSMVAGEPRMELVGPDHTFLDQLRQDGVFTERINWDTRFFIPTGPYAATVIEKVTAGRPVTQISRPGAATGGADTEPQYSRIVRKGPVSVGTYRAKLKDGPADITVEPHEKFDQSYSVEAKRGDKTLGRLTIGPHRWNKDDFSAMNVSVDKDERRKGVATALYDAAYAAGIRPIVPDTKISDEARKFWDRQRIVKLGQKPQPLEWRPTQELTRVNEPMLSRTTPPPEKVGIGADLKRMIDLFGPKMYGQNMANVTMKELLQNSFDAVKAAAKRGIIRPREGQIAITVDSGARTMRITDNGAGMTPQTVKDSFLTIAGTNKDDLSTAERSGGFGVAKLAFIFGNDGLKLTTVRDGVKTTLDTNAKELLDGKATLKTEETDEPPGTTVIVKVPEKTANDQKIVLPSYGAVGFTALTKPLIGDVMVTFSHGDGRNPEILQLGRFLDLKRTPKVTTAHFPWGDIDVYAGSPKEGFTTHNVLSSGLYQFSTTVADRPGSFGTLPYDLIFDVHPRVDASDMHYPFNNQRENWSPKVRDDLLQLSAALQRQYAAEQMLGLGGTFARSQAMPVVRGPLPAGAKAEFRDIGFAQHLPEAKRVQWNPDIEIKNGKTTDLTTGKPFDAASGFSDTEKYSPKNFTFPANAVPSNEPYFHTKLNVDVVEEASRRFGVDPADSRRFLATIGTIVQDFRGALATVAQRLSDVPYGGQPYAIWAEPARPVGVSLDKSYHGVHIKVPFRAFFINPLSVKEKTPGGIARSYVHTMFHEAAHTAVSDHNEAFTSQVAVLEGAFEDTHPGLKSELERRVVEAVTQHQQALEAMRKVFNDKDTKNTADDAASVEGQTQRSGRIDGILGRPLSSREEQQLAQGLRRGGAEGVRTGVGGGDLPGLDAALEPQYSRIRNTPPPRTAAEGEKVVQETTAGIGHNMPPGDTDKAAGEIAKDFEPPPVRPSKFLSGVRGAIERQYIFPYTLAATDWRSAKFWTAVQARNDLAYRFVHAAAEGSKKYLALTPFERQQLHAVEELDRLTGNVFHNDGTPIAAQNDLGITRGEFMNLTAAQMGGRLTDRGINPADAKAVVNRIIEDQDPVTLRRALDYLNPQLVHSKFGDIIELNPKTQDAYVERRKLFAQRWRDIMRGTAHKFGWSGEPDAAAIRKAAGEAETPSEAAKLENLAELMEAMADQERTGYVPLARNGDYFVHVTPKPGEDRESLDGFPRTIEFRLVESRTPFSGTNVDESRVPKAAEDAIKELRQHYPEEHYNVRTGYLHSNPEMLRKLDIPAIEKLLMVLQQKESELYGPMVEELQKKLYEELKAGFKKRASNVQGYSPDFTRATGEYFHHTAYHVADLMQGDAVRNAKERFLNSHPDKGTQRYWEDWDIDQKRTPWGVPLQRFGFYWEMAGNFSTSGLVGLHGPEIATYTLGLGLGMSQVGIKTAAGHLSKAYGQVLTALRASAKEGFTFPLKAIPGLKDDERRFLEDLESKGLLHSTAADELLGLRVKDFDDRSKAGQIWTQALKYLGSNVSAVDRMNRVAAALAAYRMAKNADTLKAWNKVWFGNQVYREMLQREGLTPAAMARFLMDQSIGVWGRTNQPQMQRAIPLAFQFQGFRIRLLSAMWRNAHRMGVPGKIAVGMQMLALAAFAGVLGAIPFVGMLIGGYELLMKQLGHKDPRLVDNLQALLSDSWFGQRGAEAITRGIPQAYLGTSLAERLQVGSPMSNLDLEYNPLAAIPALGIALDGIKTFANRERNQQPYGAAASLMPAFIRNPYQALVVYPREGVRTQYQAPNQPPVVAPEDLDWRDRVAKGIGYTPSPVERAYLNREFEKRLGAAATVERQGARAPRPYVPPERRIPPQYRQPAPYPQ